MRRRVHWDGNGLTAKSVRIELIEPFDARGKRLVYGRGDHFQGRTLNMDVWLSREGILYARFWSRSRYVEGCNYAVTGVAEPPGRRKKGVAALDERWVPELLRDEYDDWVVCEIV